MAVDVNAETVKNAARFAYLQSISPVEAQAFFWNYSSRKQRAAAIDAAIKLRVSPPLSVI